MLEHDSRGKIEGLREMEKKSILIIAIPKSASTSLAYTLKDLHPSLDGEIVKEHIYPSKENLNNLKDKKKVVLLREPRECRKAIERGIKSLIIKEEEKENWLEIDYERFYNGWLKNIDKKTLLVGHNKLIQEPKRVINKIEEFYGLKKSRRVKLSKMNYSRGKIGKLKRFLFRQLKKVELLRKIRNNHFPEKLKRITMVH